MVSVMMTCAWNHCSDFLVSMYLRYTGAKLPTDAQDIHFYAMVTFDRNRKSPDCQYKYICILNYVNLTRSQ